MNDELLVEIEDRVAVVRLNRPAVHNALTRGLIDGLVRAGRELGDDPSVRAIVLAGEGPSFCSGMDVSVFGGLAGDPAAFAADIGKPVDESGANVFQMPAWVWRRCPQPVIAALHGTVFGGGLQVALGADVRIVHPEARLSVREVRWGLIPDMSATQTLRDLVGLDVAKLLAFTGRVVSGDEAVRFGLATECAEDPLGAALALAAEIAAQSPDAVRAAKRLFQAAWHEPEREALAREAREQLGLMRGENFREAVQAGLEKRPPRFR